MKRLFKFFPVALAAVALASCSSDDLQSENAQALQLEDGKLYVEVEGNTTTRGGFASAVYENSEGVNSLFNALMFEEGDRIKVYCDQHNWRSQVWKLGQDQQYLKANGVASFEPEVAGEEKYVKDDEIAYGIYPYTNVKTSATETDKEAQYGWFTDEDRTSMEFNFRDQAKIAYSSEAYDYQKTANGAFTGETVEGNFYKTPFPLWGVKDAGKQVMTMKYLTGILRIDYTVADDATANNNNYLVIVADKQLNGTFKATDVDPTKLGTETPVLTPGVAAITPDDEVMTAAGVVDRNAIVVNMGNKKGHKLVYLPLPAQAYGTLKVYTGTNIAANTALSTASGTGNLTELYDVIVKGLIDAENETQNAKDKTANTVNAGVWYRVNDDASNIIDNVQTPFELAREIIKADKKAYRDFDLYVKSTIRVKNEDTAPQNFWLDLTGTVDNYGMDVKLKEYSLKHNVTVHFKVADASSTPGSSISKLYLKTMADSKKLTLAIDNDATNGLDSIIINKDQLKSEVTLIGETYAPGAARTAKNLPNIHNYNQGKLTIAGQAPFVLTNGEITIDAPTETISELWVADGCKKVNLNNGILGQLSFGDNTAVHGKEIGAEVEIVSKGNSGITKVKGLHTEATNDATNTWITTNFGTKKVKFTSVWDGTSNTQALGSAQDNNGNNTKDNIVFTAAQLANAATASGDITILAQEIDLDGKNWTPVALAKSISGDYLGKSGSGNNGVKASAQVTIKNLNITPAAAVTTGTGLFATATKDIKNLILEDVTIEAPAASSSIGALVGIANAGAAQAIHNVTLKGTNKLSVLGDGAYYIGGIVGQVNKANTALTLSDVKVEGTTEIQGYRGLGGLIGYVDQTTESVTISAAKEKVATTSYNASNTYCSVSGITFTQNANSDTDVKYDPSYAAHGNYIGVIGVASATTPAVSIYGGSADYIGTALIPTTNFYTADPSTNKGKWGYVTNGVTKYYDIKGNQQLVGCSNIGTDGAVPSSTADWYVTINKPTTTGTITYDGAQYKVKDSKPATGDGIDNYLIYINK